jgi:dipeptidyl aminopeptidase/acylaminoacyl peptidase
MSSNPKTYSKMKIKFIVLVTMIAMFMSSCDMQKEQTPPLIDREVFFDDPEIAGGRLSPDGSYISFLRPFEGTRNIWVKTLDADFDDALPVTRETERPVMSYFWSRDGKFLLYVMDKGGDENFNIYAVDPKDASEGVIPEARNITNMEGVRAQIYHISRNDHDLMFVGLNNRDRAWHDLYSLKISTGELNKIRENTNRYTSWIFDHDDKLRMASRSRMDGTNELYRMDEDGETLLYSWTVLETAYPSAFQADNTHFYLVSNVGDDVNLTQLYLMNIETGEKEFVEKDPENLADFGGMAISDKTLDLLYTAYAYERTKRYFKNEEFENHFNTVKEELGDVEISFFSPTTDESFWMVNAWSDTDPGSVYLYDAGNRELTFQYQPRPNLPIEHLSPMTSITYPSSDGLEIQAYLVLPKGFGDKDLPLVVVPHGGPWARDYWGYNSYAQFMANRGYAVLLPNFRGSTGFGKDFLNAGNRQWGELMQDDITWGVRYLIDEGIADPERVAIFGGSYGGYATLAGLAFTPEVYAAGVSFVGPSNLITLLNSIPPYWEAMRIQLHARMADPATEEGREWLKKASPLNSADYIIAPLMVVQGQNDPRVLKAESDQIVVALRDRGFPVEYLNAPDEGHGFARPVNSMAFIAAMEKFLAEHVGGRYQETMTDEVAQRLEEITVDVSTVELE